MKQITFSGRTGWIEREKEGEDTEVTLLYHCQLSSVVIQAFEPAAVIVIY